MRYKTLTVYYTDGMDKTTIAFTPFIEDTDYVTKMDTLKDALYLIQEKMEQIREEDAKSCVK